MRTITALFLLVTSIACVAEDELAEPFKTMSLCLTMNSWGYWGFWQFEVNALAGKRILIGDNDNHFIASADVPGYRHMVGGKLISEHPEAVDLAMLGSACKENCPPNYEKRVNWFKQRCRGY